MTSDQNDSNTFKITTNNVNGSSFTVWTSKKVIIPKDATLEQIIDFLNSCDFIVTGDQKIMSFPHPHWLWDQTTINGYGT